MDSKEPKSSQGVIAATIDLLAHEYGWSENHIVSLPSGQLRRILWALRERKEAKAKAWSEARISPATGEDVVASPKRGQIFDLGSDFEGALFQGKKMGLAIKDN